MTKFRELNSIDEEHPLLDGERVRTSLMMMDSIQRSVATSQPTILADGILESLHRPGYRHLATDAAAVTRRQMAYDEAEERLVNSWKTPAPGPITADSTEGILDSEFDELDCYDAYSAEISQRWRGEK